MFSFAVLWILGSNESCTLRCFKGFKPNNTEEWNRGNWTSGFVRKTPLQCDRVNTGGEEGKRDGFLKLKMMKVPDFVDWSSAFENKCEEQCLENCSCIAYAFETGVGCMSWTEKLIDTQQFSILGVDLYIRVAYSELDKVGEVKKIVIITVITRTIILFIYTYLLWRWMANKKSRKKKVTEISMFNREKYNQNFIVTTWTKLNCWSYCYSILRSWQMQLKTSIYLTNLGRDNCQMGKRLQ